MATHAHHLPSAQASSGAAGGQSSGRGSRGGSSSGRGGRGGSSSVRGAGPEARQALREEKEQQVRLWFGGESVQTHAFL